MDLTTIIRKLTTEQIERGMRWFQEMDELQHVEARAQAYCDAGNCFIGLCSGGRYGEWLYGWGRGPFSHSEFSAVNSGAHAYAMRQKVDLRQACITVLAERGAVPEPSFQTVQ